MEHGQSDSPLERARRLGTLLDEAGDEIERQRRLPPRVIEALTEAGLFRLLLPRAHGGEQCEPAQFMAALGEIARHDASTAWCLGQTNVCSMVAAYLAPDAAAEIFERGPGVLAWGAAAPLPPAHVVPGGYALSGSWSFASGGHHASWLGGHSSVVEPDGSARRDASGMLRPRTMLFPATAVRWTDTWRVLGLNGTGSDEYAVSEQFVPESFAVARDEPSERRIDEPLYRLRTDHLFGSAFASIALGLARALLDALVELAGEKTPRGYRNTLRESTVVQCEVAELEARLRSASAYLDTTFREAFEAARGGELPIEARMAIRLAVTHSLREGQRICSAAYQAAGTSSIFTATPFERRIRDINTVSQQIQGRRTHFETVGRHLLGVASETAFL